MYTCVYCVCVCAHNVHVCVLLYVRISLRVRAGSPARACARASACLRVCVWFYVHVRVDV